MTARDRVPDYSEGQQIVEVHHHHQAANGATSQKLWHILMGTCAILLLAMCSMLAVASNKIYELSERMARMETALVILTDNGKLKP